MIGTIVNTAAIAHFLQSRYPVLFFLLKGLFLGNA